MNTRAKAQHRPLPTPVRWSLTAILLSVGGLLPSQAVILFPPAESDWNLNKQVRDDPRPLELGNLVSKPTVNGEIVPAEWVGATSYEVLDPGSQHLGTLYMGIYDGFVYAANDWLINVDPNPLNGGGNAWRVGTSTAQGPANSGNGLWYEVYVQEDGALDQVRAREAASEADLQFAPWNTGANFGIEAGSFFDGNNWQYELLLGRRNPGPGPLPPSFHWEWRQMDPNPWDGVWLPVYDGTVHTPESSQVLASLVFLVATVGYCFRKRLAART